MNTDFRMVLHFMLSVACVILAIEYFSNGLPVLGLLMIFCLLINVASLWFLSTLNRK
jgi:uncharacterized membrane protein